MSKTHKITQLKKRIAELEREKSDMQTKEGLIALYMCISGLPGDKSFHNKYFVPVGSKVAKDLKSFISMGARFFAEDVEEIVNESE